jgi:hypothetical protein
MPTITAKRSSGSAKVTINHDEIRRWVEQRGGHPACVKGTERGDSCLLRIDYPGFGGEGKLEPIDWDEFFQTFDENNLAFVYQDSKNGRPSRFSKLVDRGSVKGKRFSSSGGNRGGSSGGGSRGSNSGGRSGSQSRSGNSSGGARGNRSSGGRSGSGRSGGAKSSGRRSASGRTSGRGRTTSSRSRASARR